MVKALPSIAGCVGSNLTCLRPHMSWPKKLNSSISVTNSVKALKKMSNVKKKSLKYEHIGQMIFEVNFAPNIQKLCKPIENHSIFYFLFWS